MKTKIKIAILAAVILMIAGIAAMNASAIEPGATVRAFVTSYIGFDVDPDNPANNITLVSYGFYQDKAGLTSIEPFYAISYVNMSKPTTINNDIGNGILEHAATRGYILSKTDIFIPTYQKGIT